jgi:Zn-dependent protease with chaperone function
MDPAVQQMIHSKEKFYGSLMYVLGALGWAVLVFLMVVTLFTSGLAAFVVMLGEILLFAAVMWLMRALHRAYIYGHYVLVTPEQFPHIHEIVQEGAASVGLSKAPDAFVYNSHGVMNAFAMRLFGQPYLMLTSAIIDADTDDQVRFVVGHELGHHAAGHLDPWPNFIKFPAGFIPFLAQAYSRAREMTCDRIGAYLAQDLDASRSALQMLACGSARLNVCMNQRAFEEQERLVPPVFGFLLHIFSFYPRHTARVAALSQYFERTGERRDEIETAQGGWRARLAPG